MPSTREAAVALATTITPKFEGCRLTAYPDTGGVPTIGYGHTGPEVRLGQSITQEIANHDLAVDLGTAASELEKQCGNLDTLLDNHQRAALIDFCFNLGADPSWTIWKVLRSGKLDQIPAQIQRFDRGKVGGVETVIPGLEHRRTAEIIFWNTADAAAAIAVTVTPAAVQAPPSGYTRAIDTPPAPAPTPPLNTQSLAVKVGGTVAALGAGVQQVHDIIAPHVDESHYFASAAAICTGLVIVAGVLGLIIHGEQAQARKT